MKIVINRCFGGFSLSDKAFNEWAKRKGYGTLTSISNYEDSMFSYVCAVPSWPVHKNIIGNSENIDNDLETISHYDIERTDPDLVAVVEEMGEEANGQFSELGVVEIPDDVEWYIDEYDGIEHIAEKHRTWR